VSSNPESAALEQTPPPAGGATAATASREALAPWQWTLLVGFGAFAIAMAFASRLIRDGDTHLHIAAGRWMIAHLSVPSADPFSYTFRGKPWVPHEWLSEVIYATSYALLGWGGVIATTGLAIFTAFALMARALSRWLAPALPALAATLALIMFEAHLLARPHLLAAPLMVLYVSCLIDARDRSRAPSFALLPLMVVWANIHGSFLVGVGFAVLLGLEAVWEAAPADRIRVAREWGLYALLAALAALISPNGIESYLLPLKLMTMKFAMAWLTEWHSTDFSSFPPLEGWLFIALFGATFIGLKLPVSRILMILLLLHMALSHERNTELLGFLSPLLIAKPLALHLRALGGKARALGLDGTLPSMPRRAAAVTTLAIVLGYFGTAFAFDLGGFHPNGRVAPEAALAAVRNAGITGHVLNSEVLGGFLIFEGVPPFIDGRADMYGDDFMMRFKIARDRSPDELAKLLKEYDVTWTIFPPDTEAVKFIDAMPGWTRLYSDENVVVQYRK